MRLATRVVRAVDQVDRRDVALRTSTSSGPANAHSRDVDVLRAPRRCSVVIRNRATQKKMSEAVTSHASGSDRAPCFIASHRASRGSVRPQRRREPVRHVGVRRRTRPPRRCARPSSGAPEHVPRRRTTPGCDDPHNCRECTNPDIPHPVPILADQFGGTKRTPPSRRARARAGRVSTSEPLIGEIVLDHLVGASRAAPSTCVSFPRRANGASRSASGLRAHSGRAANFSRRVAFPRVGVNI